TMPSNIARSSALCLSPRASVTVATWSETSIRTRSSLMGPDFSGAPRLGHPRGGQSRDRYERRAWCTRARCSLRLDVDALVLDELCDDESEDDDCDADELEVGVVVWVVVVVASLSLSGCAPPFGHASAVPAPPRASATMANPVAAGWVSCIAVSVR